MSPGQIGLLFFLAGLAACTPAAPFSSPQKSLSQIEEAEISEPEIVAEAGAEIGMSTEARSSLGPSSDFFEAVQESPFNLKVIEDVFDGQTLSVLGEISAKTSWPIDSVVVRLTSLKLGETVQTTFYPLKDVIFSKRGLLDAAPTEISAEQSQQFLLQVPASNTTDYQLELLWGKDAEPLLASLSSGAAGVLRAELKDLKIDEEAIQCVAPPCPVRFAFQVEIHNVGQRKIGRAVLGVGFVETSGAQVDLSQRIPQNEERLEVGELNLDSGSTRPIRVVLDQLVPADQREKVAPSVRLLDYAE